MTTVPNRIKNLPKRIFLQVVGDDDSGDPIDFKDIDTSEISWCTKKIWDEDVEYVRADLVQTGKKSARKEE